MGAGSSKPDGERSQHVFASETPVQFSQGLVESLQRNPESDSTREKTRELHIQARVAEELQRLQAHESQLLKEFEEQMSSDNSVEDYIKGQQKKAGTEDLGNKLRDLGRESVQKEIASLRKKLEGRRKLEALDKGVEDAKEDVVQCLTTNSQRPLDCWKEVETFRREVGKLEKNFVDRTLQ
ncbi:MAG: polynucleotide adenylyltransferase [Chaenotheca gracillima]|nr:MAG: polynucleotide adenylyltransferase [Chaenotheca gracillima]